MTIEDVISKHFSPGGINAKTLLSTSDILGMLTEHIEIYPAQINEVNDALNRLGFKTKYHDMRIVWLIEVKAIFGS